MSDQTVHLKSSIDAAFTCQPGTMGERVRAWHALQVDSDLVGHLSMCAACQSYRDEQERLHRHD